MSNTLRGNPVVDRMIQEVLARVTHWERMNGDMQISITRSEQSGAIRMVIVRRYTLIAGARKYKSLTPVQKKMASDFVSTLSSALGLIEVVDERCTQKRSAGKTPGLQRNFLLPTKSATSAEVTSH